MLLSCVTLKWRRVATFMKMEREHCEERAVCQEFLLWSREELALSKPQRRSRGPHSVLL